MAVKPVNASAVVVGHDVNLSIFTPPWLRDQKILSDEELAGDVVITPPMVRIPAPSFELLILPDRVQMRPSDDLDKAQSDILRVLGGIVSTLPHTPFTAIGLNFAYLMSPDEHTQFHSILDYQRRRLFEVFQGHVFVQAWQGVGIYRLETHCDLESGIE